VAESQLETFPDFKDGRLVVDRKHYTDNVTKLGVRGRVLAADRKRDLAVIELNRLPKDVVALPLAEVEVTQGEAIQSIGNPGASEALWVFNSGKVRTLYKKQFRSGAGEHDFRVVETTAPVNSGDSGGPVVNGKGELVAITQATSRRGSLISYNVAVSEVKALLSEEWKRAPLPVADVLDQVDMEYTRDETDHLLVEVELQDKSKQTVYVAKDVEYFEKADVRRIWSVASASKAAPSLETQMKLLQQNAQTKLGSWSIERTKDGDYLTVYVCKVDATATSRSLKSTVEYVARLTSREKKTASPTKTETKTGNANVLSSWLGN